MCIALVRVKEVYIMNDGRMVEAVTLYHCTKCIPRSFPVAAAWLLRAMKPQYRAAKGQAMERIRRLAQARAAEGSEPWVYCHWSVNLHDEDGRTIEAQVVHQQTRAEPELSQRRQRKHGAENACESNIL